MVVGGEREETRTERPARGWGDQSKGGSCGVRAERRRDGEEEQVREMRQSKAERLAPQPPRI